MKLQFNNPTHSREVLAMSATVKVAPRLMSGFRDLSQRDAILKREILEIVIREFERFGFDPFESATVHLESVLFGADEWTDMAYFRAWNNRQRMKVSSEKMALRFDLTVPLGRFVAENLETIPRPFARWQVGNVFRGEKPRAGRFCEFTQCDADILFAPNTVSDAQIVILISNVMLSLGVSDFVIKVNNRKILNGLPVLIGFEAKHINTVLRILDKQEKDGEESVREELLAAVGADKAHLCLSSEQVDRLMDFTGIHGISSQKLTAIRLLMNKIPIAMEGVAELQQILDMAKAAGVDPDNIEFDPSMVRGLGYYTGPIFECVLTDSVAQELKLGAVFAGGRYDNLVERFSEHSVPATGASFGIDRFMEYAVAAKLLPSRQSMTQVLVAYQPEFVVAASQVAAALRRKGLKTLLYDGAEFTFRHQLGHANQKEIPWVIIIGEQEAASGSVTLKNMETRDQNTVSVERAIEAVLQADSM